MNYFQIIFFQAFAISLLGSAPPGLINLSLFAKGFESNTRTLISWAFLAAILEGIHILTATLIHIYWQSAPEGFALFKPVSILLLFAVAWLNWPKSKIETAGKSVNMSRFLVINIFNLAGIPFWLVACQLMDFQRVGLVPLLFGAELGAFFCLVIYALSGKFFAKHNRFPTWQIQRFISISFSILGLFQIYQTYFNA